MKGSASQAEPAARPAAQRAGPAASNGQSAAADGDHRHGTAQAESGRACNRARRLPRHSLPARHSQSESTGRPAQRESGRARRPHFGTARRPGREEWSD